MGQTQLASSTPTKTPKLYEKPVKDIVVFFKGFTMVLARQGRVVTPSLRVQEAGLDRLIYLPKVTQLDSSKGGIRTHNSTLFLTGFPPNPTLSPGLREQQSQSSSMNSLTHRDLWLQLVDHGVPRREVNGHLLNSYLTCINGRVLLGQLNRSLT